MGDVGKIRGIDRRTRKNLASILGVAFVCVLSGSLEMRLVASGHARAVSGIRQGLNDSITAGDLKAKASDFQLVFKDMYESGRTISLLPGMRANVSGNRHPAGR